jgi:hypothetical protein
MMCALLTFNRRAAQRAEEVRHVDREQGRLLEITLRSRSASCLAR